jgi:16S rRNA (cytidine1402-2'-O)-methyltransferase
VAWPSGKAEACKASIPQFESGCHLMLYIVSTPIGNLQDITLRALDQLKKVSYILCEDTRQSSKLLNHFEISRPLVSFHLFNEKERQDKIIQDLQDGQDIALISDAGTPLIADPGATLIERCRSLNIAVTALPGPTALITALTLSGFSTTRFQFIGFLPKKETEIEDILYELLDYPGTTICYESPNRVHKTLSIASTIDPDMKVVVARELTKRYETILAGTCQELLPHTKELLGEVVLLFEGTKKEKKCAFTQKLLQQLVQDLVTEGSSVKDAIAQISVQLNVPRKEVYKAAHLAVN